MQSEKVRSGNIFRKQKSLSKSIRRQVRAQVYNVYGARRIPLACQEKYRVAKKSIEVGKHKEDRRGKLRITMAPLTMVRGKDSSCPIYPRIRAG